MKPSEHWVCLSSFSHTYEAHLLRGRLEACDIPVCLENENIVTANWLYSNAVGGVRLMVPESRVAEAKALLADFGNTD